MGAAAYRYTLSRSLQPGPEAGDCAGDRGVVLVVGCNPSTADDTQDDATIRKPR